MFIENWERAKLDRPFLGLPVVWVDCAAPYAATHRALCSLGTTRRRAFIEQVSALGFAFATVSHPLARVSRRATIGAGSLLSAGVIVAVNAVIGRHVIVNRGVLIGHDTVIYDYVTLSPGVNVAGIATIGEGTYIGMGAVVLDRVRIGSGSVVAAGSLVTHDVPDHVRVMGIPAHVVEENVQGH